MSQVRFMGDGKREGDEVLVGYPCERVSSVRLSLSIRPLMMESSSRKPFVPADHWLVKSQLDMNSFVEAAVYVPRFTFSIPVPLHTPDSASKHNSYRNQAHTTSPSTKWLQCHPALGSSIISLSPSHSKSASRSSRILS